MNCLSVRKYETNDLDAMIAIWNEIVEAGDAFPQEEPLTRESGTAFFAAQTFVGVAVDESDGIVGLYILHPNNVGRCGHIANASYAVRSDCRGRHTGEMLVLDCRAGLSRTGEGAWIRNPPIQRRGRREHPCAASLRTPRVYPARHDPARLPNEGWNIRQHLPLLSGNDPVAALKT